MNIDEQTYEKFQQLYQAEPIIDVDMFFEENLMAFIELLAPYASEGEDMNKLTMYMLGQNPEAYQVFMFCLLSLGKIANSVNKS